MNYRSSKLAALILLPVLALAGCGSDNSSNYRAVPVQASSTETPKEDSPFKKEMKNLAEEFETACREMSKAETILNSMGRAAQEREEAGKAWNLADAKLNGAVAKRKQLEMTYGIGCYDRMQWRCANVGHTYSAIPPEAMTDRDWRNESSVITPVYSGGSGSYGNGVTWTSGDFVGYKVTCFRKEPRVSVDLGRTWKPMTAEALGAALARTK